MAIKLRMVDLLLGLDCGRMFHMPADIHVSMGVGRAPLKFSRWHCKAILPPL